MSKTPSPAARIAAVAAFYNEQINLAVTCDGTIVKYPDGSAVWCLTAEEYAFAFDVDAARLGSYSESVESDGLLFIVYPC